MKIGTYTILDGNGDPIEDGMMYFNRYQSTIQHTMSLTRFALKKYNTVGGFVRSKPVVYFVVKYANGKTRRSYFDSQFITDGVYAFHQLIPVSKGIKLGFEYCNTTAMIEAYKRKLGVS